MNLDLFKSRKCFRCHETKPLTVEFFYNDKGRIEGLSYECKLCLSARKIGKDKRDSKQRWASMTKEEKKKRRSVTSIYDKTFKGTLVSRINSYIKIDRSKGQVCDLTKDDMAAMMIKPCHYCGDREGYMGADRKDNSKGHTKENCVPACRVCNVSRMDNFTYEEMKILGRTIAEIKRLRASPDNADNR